MSEPQRPVKPFDLAGIAVLGVVAGALLGAVTNAINVSVGAVYFKAVMGWDTPEVVFMALVQGIFEGVLFGIVFSLIFTVVSGIVTGATATIEFLGRHLAGVCAGAVGCWIIGGLVAMGLASLSPAWYRQAFRNVPEASGELLQYAWVGGSIWGLQIGGFVSLVLGLVILRANWVRRAPTLAEDEVTEPLG